MNAKLTSIIEVIKLAEKLKFELRHSYLSNGRHESVAEHTWRVSLMAFLIEPLLSKPVNTEKLLKMIIIHDLVEALSNDISATLILQDPSLKKIKRENEMRAIERIKNLLIATNGEEIYALFHEFENKTTYEAKVANALDKLEAQLQHNQSDFSTWEEIEYEMVFLLKKHVEFDPILIKFENQIVNDSIEILKNNAIDIERTKLKSEKWSTNN